MDDDGWWTTTFTLARVMSLSRRMKFCIPVVIASFHTLPVGCIANVFCYCCPKVHVPVAPLPGSMRPRTLLLILNTAHNTIDHNMNHLPASL